MIRFFLILLLMFSFFNSCKKEKPNFTIKGIVTDNTFNKALNQAVLNLYEIEVGSKKSTLVSTINSDANGNYSFNFPRNKVEKYLITVSKENYFNTEYEINFSALTTNSDNIRNFDSNAKSWVNIHFDNQDNDLSKTIEFGIQEGKTDCEECCPDTRRVLTKITDTNIVCINNGNSTYSVLTVTDTLRTFSINTIPFDTVSLEIPF